jgi:hypothetical protein
MDLGPDMISSYEQYVTEQENRKFFGKPTRFTTIMCYPDKMDYETFINELRSFDTQDNLKSGKMYIEEWVEFLMAYHEIEPFEPEDKEELKYRTFQIDQNYEYNTIMLPIVQAIQGTNNE